jgi:hypothetical protein
MRTTRYLPLLLAVWLMLPGALFGQDPAPRHMTSSLGIFQYDIAGSGFGPMVAFRGTTPLSSVLVLEGGVMAARPRSQPGQARTFVVPEAQFHLTLPFQAFLPYMGLGGGAAFYHRDAAAGGFRTDLTISGSLGFRTWIGQRAGIHVEFRGRGIGLDFESSASEYTAGLIWRL